MDKDLKREKTRRKYFSTGGLIINSILGILGLLMIYYSGIFDITDSNTLYDCISKNGIMIIFGIFFFLVSLYGWILFFLNVILPPKKEVLYLKKAEDKEAIFLNKKGKKINYIIENENLEEKSHYTVLKTNNYIYQVLEKTNDSWIPKERNSYWLNFYSPVGNFENVMLLPLVYVMLFPGLLIIIMSQGYLKIYGIIFIIIPFYIIVYDLIYKIKLRQSNNQEIDDKIFVRSYEILQNSIKIIGVSLMVAILSWLFYRTSGLIPRLIISPFLCYGLCAFGLVLSRLYNNYKLEQILQKVAILIFLMYWFGILSFGTVSYVKDGNYMFSLFLIPFWLCGIFAFYKYIIKNK